MTNEIAYGIIDFLKTGKNIPIVIRLVGTREEEGKKILSENAIPILNTMEEAIIKIIQILKNT